LYCIKHSLFNMNMNSDAIYTFSFFFDLLTNVALCRITNLLFYTINDVV